MLRGPAVRRLEHGLHRLSNRGVRLAVRDQFDGKMPWRWKLRLRPHFVGDAEALDIMREEDSSGAAPRRIRIADGAESQDGPPESINRT